LQGKYALTTIKYKQLQSKAVITILNTKGAYSGQLKTRAYQFEMASTRKATKALLNKKEVRVLYDPEKLINMIKIPESAINKSQVIEIYVSEAEQNEIEKNMLKRNNN